MPFKEYEMSRCKFSLATLLLTCTALAAPAPQPFTAGWDSPLDPDKDCKFVRDKRALIMEMPGSDHDYDPHRERLNAPRILRNLEGDFDMQVQVQIACLASRKSTVERQPSFVVAGFLLIPPPSYGIPCIRLEYGLAGQESGKDGYVALKHQDKAGGYSNAIWSRSWKNWPLPEKTDHAYLRIKREGEKLYPSISPNGEKWTSLVGSAQFGRLPAKLKVGLAAYSTSTEPAKVRFEDFKLIRGKKKER
jgi:hypothetical protein